MTRQLRVFLCHSSTDKPAVRELYDRLLAEGWIDPWLDEKNLLPGQDWDLAIEKAVEESHAVIVCLSQSSVTKEGYIQKELRFVLDIALTKPEEEIFIIPLRLEDCQPPRRLRVFHYVDYFPKAKQDSAYQYVLQSLKRRAESLKIEVIDAEALARQQAEERARKEWTERIEQEAREKVRREMEERLRTEAEDRARREFAVGREAPPHSGGVSKPTEIIPPKPSQAASLTYGDKITLSNGMELLRVPAGKFLMGSNIGADDENPQHTVDLSYDYWMARYPVANEQYNAYVKAKSGKHPVDGWEKKKGHPLVRVSWNDIMEYSKWLNQILNSEITRSGQNLEIRLPSEAEWEKAARSTDGREYPWGNTFDKNKCNSKESGKGRPTPVGAYSPQGDSPYGCADMAGNVWEWTCSEYKAYPYNATDGREDKQKIVARVMRGGACSDDELALRCACRVGVGPSGLYDDVGFRVMCVVSPISL
jgi:formylglycine-generating enzyme required for sulfatase activity